MIFRLESIELLSTQRQLNKLPPPKIETIVQDLQLRAVLRIFAPQTSCWGEGAIFFLILYVWGRCDGGGVHVLIAGAGDHGQSITTHSQVDTGFLRLPFSHTLILLRNVTYQ